jgi:hypothetical protein
MNPPWIEYPDIPAGMGWNMGFGQNYNVKFTLWFQSLCTDDQKTFITAHPPPNGWTNYYTNIIQNPLPTSEPWG